MLADEDQLFLDTLSLFLEESDYVVLACATVEDALFHLNRNEIETLILNPALRDDGADEILFYLGIAAKRRPPRVILVQDSSTLSSAEDWGTAHVFVKPFPFEELLKALKE